MADARCCDRCGKFEKLPGKTKWRFIDRGEPSAVDPCGDRAKSVICDVCEVDFISFMANIAVGKSKFK